MAETTQVKKIHKTEAEWKALLTPEQFHVMREGGTERAFTGALVNNHEDGIYHCGSCNTPLFLLQIRSLIREADGQASGIRFQRMRSKP